jgi:SH3-like domain-containing protein
VTHGQVTGLPVPRFVSLRGDRVNLRVGPGLRFPIEWVLQRRSLPVQVVREFKDWRAVRLPDGTGGWVHSGTISGRRTFLVNKGRPRVLRSGPSVQAQPLAHLQEQVVGHILSCAAHAAWCRVQVSGYKGFLPRETFWGTFGDEEVAR